MIKKSGREITNLIRYLATQNKNCNPLTDPYSSIGIIGKFPYEIPKGVLRKIGISINERGEKLLKNLIQFGDIPYPVK